MRASGSTTEMRPLRCIRIAGVSVGGMGCVAKQQVYPPVLLCQWEEVGSDHSQFKIRFPVAGDWVPFLLSPPASYSTPGSTT